MGRFLDDQLGPARALNRERDLVRHRRRREVDGLLLPEETGGTLFEREHRRILAPLLVADLRRSHRSAHSGRWFRLGVGAEIDHDDDCARAKQRLPEAANGTG